MARHEQPVPVHDPRQPAPAGPGRPVPAPAQARRCPGAAAQLAAVHRTLRHGPVLQLEAGGGAAGGAQPATVPRAAVANRTGLPDRLKSGVEALSGLSLDGVRVHYNSAGPAQLNAHAYAQGTDIHLAPGQEAHLPHEAWHVVQQAQGRVRSTLQMKEGVPVNDDAGLEHEADVMGARASGWGRDKPGAGTNAPHGSPRPVAASAAVGKAAPHQLYVAPVAAPLPNAPQPKFSDIYPNPGDEGILVQIDWVTYAERIYALINAVRPTLADDADIGDLARQEADVDAAVTQANTHVRTFDETGRSNRVSISDTLHADRARMIAFLAALNERYAATEGGFSAKGRANAIANVTNNRLALQTDNRFISNISINGRNLTDSIGVVKPVTAPDAGAIRLNVNGTIYNQGQNRPLYNDALEAPRTSQAAQCPPSFPTVDRQGGQEVNMNNTNARGYAWVTNTNGWNTTQWEWLHIRGASLGGVTGPANLVLGTRDANTHMMPFETNLKVLAAYVSRRGDVFDRLNVTWSIANQVHPHSYQSITIAWSLHKTSRAPRDLTTPSGSARFSPLDAGAVLSKTEVGFLEDALRDARPPEDVQLEDEPMVQSGSGDKSGSGSQGKSAAMEVS